ncbi:hypothetical protein RZS28_18670 (plasmid) [Methylocapsa polymorpha]|uniref:Uncharacterized protein n=1 Tax=Methylocapsa polymorpha TaxID=3080828 RepID=A0ABZ0HWZ1_9HYPH|nr:hypothetical protein [Methylocapsa sp. RX1]WOJ91753.1 hypothetical protein RZS28_18670 [Methylocapsa sp. RX1]
MSKPNFLSLLNPQFTWPEPGDWLFVAPGGRADEGTLTSHAWTRLVLMADGYREAADRLVDAVAADAVLQSTVVYPVIFLYRHFMELKLKYVLVTYGQHFDEDADWKSHSLTDLWAKVRPIIETAGNGTDDGGANDAVEACIREMSAADPMSFSFRYPVEKGGKPIVLAFETVDLGNLRRTMRKIANYFDGLDGLLDHLTSA